MTLPRVTFSTFCCFLLPIAIAMTFPMQVMYGSVEAGSVSLVLQFVLLLGLLLTRRVRQLPLARARHCAMWDSIAAVFLIIVLIDTPISLMTFGAAAKSQVMPSLYLLVQAALIYFYFSRVASDADVKSFFAGMVVMGLISGSFFLFDTFYKLALGRVTSYALKAHAYSTAAGGTGTTGPGVNTFRIDIAYRSFGLLERHATSALWMSFGLFAYSFLQTDLAKKRTAFGFTLFALLIGQNFTSIIAFVAVSALLYRKNIRVRYWTYPLLGCLPVIYLFRDRIAVFYHILVYLFTSQIKIALLTHAEAGDYSLKPELIGSWGSYFKEVMMRPNELLLGFGMGSNPYFGTGGHFGYLEAILRVGMVFWIVFTLCIAGLVRVAMREARRVDAPVTTSLDSRLIVAASSILACTWLMDLHYSAWPNKSVWPLLFFAMAVVRRVGRPRPAGAVS